MWWELGLGRLDPETMSIKRFYDNNGIRKHGKRYNNVDRPLGDTTQKDRLYKSRRTYSCIGIGRSFDLIDREILLKGLRRTRR